jgi:hypothetical protein
MLILALICGKILKGKMYALKAERIKNGKA